MERARRSTGSGAIVAGIAATMGGDGLPREWNQPHGNAAGPAFVDVEPIRGDPEEAWRHPFEDVLAGPVVSGDRVFVVVREARKPRLLAIRASSGEILATKTLEIDGSGAQLVVARGVAAIVTPRQLLTFRVFDDQFRLLKSFPGPWFGVPSEADGRLLVRGAASRLVVIDLVGAKELGSLTPGPGRPSLVRSADDGRYAMASSGGFDEVDNFSLRVDAVDLARAPPFGSAGRRIVVASIPRRSGAPPPGGCARPARSRSSTAGSAS